jgi:hypothetical protein
MAKIGTRCFINPVRKDESVRHSSIRVDKVFKYGDSIKAKETLSSGSGRTVRFLGY